MEQTEKVLRKREIIYIVAFFVLNILNCFLVTAPFYNHSINSYTRTPFMIFNYMMGEMGFFIIIFALAILIFKKDTHRFFFMLIISIINALVCIAMMVFSYNYYGMMFSFGNLKALDNPAKDMAYEFVFAVLGDLLKHVNFVSLVPPVILLVIYLSIKKVVNTKNKTLFNKGRSRAYFGLSLLVIGVLSMINSLGAYKIKIEETWYEENRDILYGVQTVGMYNYYIYDFYTYYFTDIYSVNGKNALEIEKELSKYESDKQESLVDGKIYGNNSEVSGAYEGKNLILIQTESLSNYVIGLKIDGQEVTPNLNRMAREGIYFDNFYTTVGIGNTSDAEFSVMTGLYPNGEDLSVYTFDKANYTTMAKDFKSKGYNANSFHGNTKIFYSRGDIHTRVYGFDNHFGYEDLSGNDVSYVHNWISDLSLFEKSVDYMQETDGPDFVFDITVSCHTPFVDDEEVLKILNQEGFNIDGKIDDDLFFGYLKHCFYVDYAFGNLLKYLEEKDMLEDTVIMLYGDHGGGISNEAFIQNKDVLENEMNPFEEELFASSFEHGNYAYRKLAQEIPFIIYEGATTKSLNPEVISLVRGETDIYRTVANLYNLDSQYYFGVDALSDANSFIYNPRNLDVFFNDVVLFVQSETIYTPSSAYLSQSELQKRIAAVREFKSWNDKLLKYKNYKKN